jgi:hypothetical protein
MIKDISRHIGDLVTQIDNTIQGQFVPMEGVTETCRTKYARSGKSVKDADDIEHIITEVEVDNYIKAGEVTGLIYLPQPYYISGTRLAANREWTIAESDLMKKTPLIWLLHDIRYFQYGRESVYDWESELRIFFLDETDILDYYTADHISNVVEPMAELCRLFIETVNKNRGYKTIDTYEITNFTRFGVEEQSGMVRNILDANLSGVELSITLTKYKENCKC